MAEIPLTRSFPESSAISFARYDPERRFLDIWYRGGDPYRYFEVPFEAYEALLNADSTGEFVNREIKAFDYEPLQPA